MQKYRIVKIEKTNSKGVVDTSFVIQKKFLFWWTNYLIRLCFFCQLRNSRKNIRDGATIHPAVLKFDSFETANWFLEKAQNPFKERYKGDLIGVAYEKDMREVFINYSFYDDYFSRNAYQYSYSIEGLKKKIDLRKSNPVLTFVQSS